MFDLAPGKPGTQSAKEELLQLLKLLRVESGQQNKGAAHHDRIAVERVEAEAVVTLTAERDRARDDYRWMVEHAADQKLDGYRELGARVAAAETRVERTEAQLAEAISWAWNLGDELDSNHARWVIGQLAERLGVKVTLPPENEPNNRLREQLAAKDREIDSLELDVAQAETRVGQAENRATAQAALTEAAERWADTPADDPDIHEIEAALLDTITKFRVTLAAPEATEEA